MIDRRQMLAAGAGAAALGAGVANAQAPAAGSEDAKLHELLMRQFNENIDDSPENATSLGLDTGARAPLRFKLNDRSLAKIAQDKADAIRRQAELKAIDRARLSPASAVTYDVVGFSHDRAAERARKFDFGTGGPSPYVVTQRSGAYQQIPDWLDNQHRVASKEDADAYVARVEAFATVLDQQTEVVRHDAGKGVVPPDFMIDKTIAQLETLANTPGADSTLSQSVARRAAAANIAGDHGAAAARLVDEKVRPAAARQAELMRTLRANAVHDAGVWRLPKGAELYAETLKQFTTTNLSAEEIHQMGLDQVADLQRRLDGVLREAGYTDGSVGDRIKAASADPRYLWPNTDEGRAQLLQSLNEQMAELEPKLPQVFKTLPKAKVEIRRVPPSIELGASGGYYQGAPLDGSRPGAYYINLHNTHDWPKWALPTLTYHEASPGYHFQISISREAGELPIYRRLSGNSAYNEGWGLYAERVADELGAYEDYKIGRLGYLQSYLFRATRLVVDTGLHHKRWSREQAIAWMRDNAGEPEGSAIREIERYAANPGQACSYKIGQTVIERLRADAEKRLGSKFDIRGFHDAVLLNGSVPLTVLERRVNDWMASQA